MHLRRGVPEFNRAFMEFQIKHQQAPSTHPRIPSPLSTPYRSPSSLFPIPEGCISDVCQTANGDFGEAAKETEAASEKGAEMNRGAKK